MSPGAGAGMAGGVSTDWKAPLAAGAFAALACAGGGWSAYEDRVELATAARELAAQLQGEDEAAAAHHLALAAEGVQGGPWGLMGLAFVLGAAGAAGLVRAAQPSPMAKWDAEDPPTLPPEASPTPQGSPEPALEGPRTVESPPLRPYFDPEPALQAAMLALGREGGEDEPSMDLRGRARSLVGSATGLHTRAARIGSEVGLALGAVADASRPSAGPAAGRAAEALAAAVLELESVVEEARDVARTAEQVAESAGQLAGRHRPSPVATHARGLLREALSQVADDTP